MQETTRAATLQRTAIRFVRYWMSAQPYCSTMPCFLHRCTGTVLFVSCVTGCIERDNSNTRHHLARFTRRTKVVSQCEKMVGLSL